MVRLYFMAALALPLAVSACSDPDAPRVIGTCGGASSEAATECIEEDFWFAFRDDFSQLDGLSGRLSARQVSQLIRRLGA